MVQPFKSTTTTRILRGVDSYGFISFQTAFDRFDGSTMLWRIAIIVFALLSFTPAQASKKVALLIGNANYISTSAELRNPPNDVSAMKAMLEAAEFEVTVLSDATRVSMSEALDAFSEKSNGAEVGIIYYSGHGIELDGINYLVPIDAQLKSDRSAKYEAVTLDDAIAAVSGATTLKLVLLDACRDNPFVNSMKRVTTRGAPTRGLARVDTSDHNLLIGYATSPGAVASDGEGSNSPYAQALVRHLTRPGLEIESALRAVAKEVHVRTEGKQVPFKTGSLFETVMLGPSEGAEIVDNELNLSASTSAVDDPTGLLAVSPENKWCKDEARNWDSVKTSIIDDELVKHIKTYPLCNTAELATIRLGALRAQRLKLMTNAAGHRSSGKLDKAIQAYEEALALGMDDAMIEIVRVMDHPMYSSFDKKKAIDLVDTALRRGNLKALDLLLKEGEWSQKFEDSLIDHLKYEMLYVDGTDQTHWSRRYDAIKKIFAVDVPWVGCTKKSEYTSGLAKVCVYDCQGVRERPMKFSSSKTCPLMIDKES